MFKHHRYPKFIILQAVYFKFRFTLSYRDNKELMKIRGVKVDHSTIERWVFKYAPMIEASMHKKKIEFVLVREWMKPILRWLVKTGIFIEQMINSGIPLTSFSPKKE